MLVRLKRGCFRWEDKRKFQLWNRSLSLSPALLAASRPKTFPPCCDRLISAGQRAVCPLGRLKTEIRTLWGQITWQGEILRERFLVRNKKQLHVSKSFEVWAPSFALDLKKRNSKMFQNTKMQFKKNAYLIVSAPLLVRRERFLWTLSLCHFLVVKCSLKPGCPSLVLHI